MSAVPSPARSKYQRPAAVFEMVTVGQAQPDDRQGEAGVGERLEHGAAEFRRRGTAPRRSRRIDSGRGSPRDAGRRAASRGRDRRRCGQSLRAELRPRGEHPMQHETRRDQTGRRRRPSPPRRRRRAPRRSDPGGRPAGRGARGERSGAPARRGRARRSPPSASSSAGDDISMPAKRAACKATSSVAYALGPASSAPSPTSVATSVTGRPVVASAPFNLRIAARREYARRREDEDASARQAEPGGEVDHALLGAVAVQDLCGTGGAKPVEPRGRRRRRSEGRRRGPRAPRRRIASTKNVSHWSVASGPSGLDLLGGRRGARASARAWSSVQASACGRATRRAT